MRKAAGESSFHLFRSVDDPSKAFLLIKWKSMDSAKAFMASDRLDEVRRQAGVVDSKDYLLVGVSKGSP